MIKNVKFSAEVKESRVVNSKVIERKEFDNFLDAEAFCIGMTKGLSEKFCGKTFIGTISTLAIREDGSSTFVALQGYLNGMKM